MKKRIFTGAATALVTPMHDDGTVNYEVLDEIIEELKSGKFARIAERSGREQDKEDGGGLESLRRNGYM